jgi:hypothetical protein
MSSAGSEHTCTDRWFFSIICLIVLNVGAIMNSGSITASLASFL